MVSIPRMLRDYREAGALNSLIGIWGFVRDGIFLTKSGHLGLVVRVEGTGPGGLDLRPATRHGPSFRGRAPAARRALARVSVHHQTRRRSVSPRHHARDLSRERPSVDAQIS